VDGHVFKQVFRLARQFRIQPDIAGAVIAASPLGLHSLQKIRADRHAEFRSPRLDQLEHGFIKQGFAPRVYDFSSDLGAGAGANGEGNPPMVERDLGLRIFIANAQQVAPAPKLARFARNEFARRFPGQRAQFGLSVLNRAERGNRVGARRVEPRLRRRD